MAILRIDGSQGEGGGQILRSALSLSAITGKAFLIENIRAGRKKPGLLRQHLTAVRAAQEICGAQVRGDTMSSRELRFEPHGIRAGSYSFAVGTAGSACLVAQTLIPILLNADRECHVSVSGGTHNPNAPPYDFLEQVFAVALSKLGASITTRIERHGFYPAGGGALSVAIEPWKARHVVAWLAPGAVRRIDAGATFAKLPFHIAERELETVAQLFPSKRRDIPRPRCRPHQVASSGPGNTVSILIERDLPELVTAFGEVGRTAEKVAEKAVAQAVAFIEADVPVGEHLADQLLIPMALAGGGTFRTRPLTAHTRTNITTLEAFLDVRVQVTESTDGQTATIRMMR